LRVQHVEATLDFGATSGDLSFDEDTYDFHAQITPPGAATPTTVASFTQKVVQGTDYLFVLAEVSGAVQPLILATPTMTDTSQTQVAAVHAAPTIPSMDLYFVAPGADPASATPLGSLAFSGTLAPAGLAPGDYQLVLTDAGDPSMLDFRSQTMTLAAGAANDFVITEGDGEGLVPFSVVVSGPNGGILLDQNTPAGLEVVNAAADGAPRDLYLDGDYTAPVVSGLASPGVSPPLKIAPGDHTLDVTPAGNPGVVEIQQAFTAVQGGWQTGLIGGDPGSLAAVGVQDNRRPIAGEALIRFMDAATLFATGVNVYLAAPGTDTTTILPVVTLTTPGLSQRGAFAPGDYELSLRDASGNVIPFSDENGNLVAEPQPVSLPEGLFTVLITNGTASGTARIVLLQGFQ
ncbi:MAG TPA: DUF4397 domain-containing protein, partial [Gammaproteobacteria bacterium]|nr:DUF4397 domain-containing protein [Gammaproteobacteria bacterium]